MVSYSKVVHQPALLETQESTPNSLLIYFLISSFAPQTEHLPSAAIFGCSATSPPQSPHFTKISHLQRTQWISVRDISDKTFVVA
jgi:hypothetical protein